MSRLLADSVMAGVLLPARRLDGTGPVPTVPAKDRQSKDRMLILQGFRGIAAVLVVVFHVSHSIFRLPKYWMARPFGDLFEFGHAGVEFFFVLSGFIIYFVHRRDIGNRSRLGDFLWKRFRRIYPPYWIITFLVVPVFYFEATTGTGSERLPSIWFDSFFLIHILHGGGQVLSVSWTLFHEVLFYGVFALSIISRRFGAAAFMAWMLACVGVYCWGSGPSPMVAYYLSPLHLLFGMGAASAWLIGTRRIAAPLWWAAVGLGIFLAAAAAEVSGAAPESATLSLCYGLGSAILVVGTVALERAGRLSVPPFLTALGNASYSIYLVHFVAISAAAKLLRRLVDNGAPLPPVVVFVSLAVVGVAAGLVFHALVEAPLDTWLRRWKVGYRPPMIPTAGVN